MSEAAARLREVSFSYRPGGSPVFDRHSLAVPAGRITRLHGTNGSGKSTLVELLAGVLVPTRGEVTVLGEDPRSPDLRSRRAVARTGVGLFPELTVQEHVSLAARWGGLDPATIEARLERYGAGPWVAERVSALSTGNARRANLVLCTLGEPELLVLDEPFNGLDEHASGELLADLTQWRAEGRTVLLVAHQLAPEVEALVDETLDLEAPEPARPLAQGAHPG